MLVVGRPYPEMDTRILKERSTLHASKRHLRRKDACLLKSLAYPLKKEYMQICLFGAPLRARMSTYLHVPRAPGDTVCEHTVGEDVSILTSAARPEVWGGKGGGEAS